MAWKQIATPSPATLKLYQPGSVRKGWRYWVHRDGKRVMRQRGKVWERFVPLVNVGRPD